MVWLLLIFVATILLAYSAADNNFKGVATLFVSETSSYKEAINLETIIL